MIQQSLQYSCASCSDHDKEVRGCSLKSGTIVMAHGVNGYATRCPVIDAAEMGSYFRIYNYWEHGHYPNAGTWADQPHRLVLIMEEISGFTTRNTD
nr:hypothetical protein [Rhodospirillales bacterium]